MHDTREMLTRFGLTAVETKTEKWTSVVDTRQEFRKYFDTNRLGKIQDGNLYVTVGILGLTARSLMNKYRLPILELQTTSGQKKDAYPGFELNSCPAEALELFLEGLRAAVDSHLALDSAKS